jgi:hypothetical protein
MNYESFVDALEKSRSAVFRVAEWLHRHGKEIVIPPIRVVPKGGNASEYVDKCDLYAGGDRIEVKHKNINFTSEKDFPWDTVIVSNAKTIERNWGLITAYIVVNNKMTHAMIITSDKKDLWWKEKLKPKNKTGEEEFYFCKKEDAIFRKISE